MSSDERNEHLRTVSELQQLVLEKEKCLKEVRVKLKSTIEEKEAIRARLIEMSNQMEQLTREIKRIQSAEGASVSSNMSQLLKRPDSTSAFTLLSTDTLSQQQVKSDVSLGRKGSDQYAGTEDIRKENQNKTSAESIR